MYVRVHAFTFSSCKDKFVQKRGVARLWVVVARLQGSISYFLVARSSQMNVEAASDVDPKY